MTSVRDHALKIIQAFWSSKDRLKTITEDYFARCEVGGSDRHRITVLVREVIRWKSRLDLWIEAASGRSLRKIQPQLLIILEIAVYEIKFDEGVPLHAAIHSAVELAANRVGTYSKGFTNAVLRKVSVLEKADLNIDLNQDSDLAVWYSFPLWLVKRWKLRFGQQSVELLLEASNRNPGLTARICPDRISSGDFLTLCRASDIVAEGIGDSDRFFSINKNAYLLLQHDLFQSGAFSFQDRGAGMLVELLDPQPGETILDVCAAPGTKALYLAELVGNSGKVYASDNDPSRVRLGIRDIQRHGRQTIEWQTRDAARDVFPSVDKILLDVPCSGTGVIRRRPDIKWRCSPEQMEAFAGMQLSILSNMSQYVKSGGKIVYGTCTLEPEENIGVIQRFLGEHKNFMIDKQIPEHLKVWQTETGAIETNPAKDSLDGMFGVRLKKIN